MSPFEQRVLAALRNVRYPGFSRDIVSLGVVERLRVDAGIVEFEIVLGAGPPGASDLLQRAARSAVQSLEGVHQVKIHVRDGSGPGSRSQGRHSALRMAGKPPAVAAAHGNASELVPEVRHTIAVASGKGGVGKSTITVNLAVALAASGATVGLLDADVYGPSIPIMTGIDRQVEWTADKRMVPFTRFGVRIMSLGFLVPPGSAVIWRGPLLVKALDQLLRDVVWGELDFLLVDMPPGTGDVQLTLAQKVRLAGAVIVTTPQDVALADARKGVAMFRKVNVPILGIVENMSYFRCPHCSERTEIFGHGGGRLKAEQLGVPCLGEVPLHPSIREASDAGNPVVVDDPESPRSKVFWEIADRLRSTIGEAATSAVDPG